MTSRASVLQELGAFGFGGTAGWFLYYVNRWRGDTVKVTDVATVLGAIGGGAVTALFPAGTDLFGAYGIGLAVGFFGYLVLLMLLVGKSDRYDRDFFIDGLPKDRQPPPAAGQHPLGRGPGAGPLPP